MQPTYNKLQQVLCLNILANSAAGQSGDVAFLEDYAKQKINLVFADLELKHLIGDWQLVWGPVVYQFPGGQFSLPASNVADNTMFVAQRKDTNEYVVSIAGTNPDSTFAWKVQDLTLSPMVAWPYNGNTGTLSPRIAQGTSIGLDILLNQMTDGGNTLAAFLGTLISGASEALDVTVTGHSMGGTLSPVVALALADTQGMGSPWDPNFSAILSVFPTAGLSPGDKDFAQYYDQRLGTRTNRVWNTLDMFPHFWQLDTLSAVPLLYYPYIPTNILDSLIIGIAKLRSFEAGNMHQIAAQTPGLQSQVNLDIVIDHLQSGPSVDAEDVKQLGARLGKHRNWPQSVLDQIDQYIDETFAVIRKRVKRDGHVRLSEVLSATSKSTQKMKQTRVDGISASLLEIVRELIAFVYQVIWQHSIAYYERYGVSQFAQKANTIAPPT